MSDIAEEEDDSLSESEAESSEWEGPVRGRRTQQKGAWLVSESDSDYHPSRGRMGGRKGRRKKGQRNHWRTNQE